MWKEFIEIFKEFFEKLKCLFRRKKTTKNDECLGPPLQHISVKLDLRSSPPWRETLPLAFEHLLVMLGTNVIIPSILVPLMGGTNVEKAEVISTSLFVAAINTLLQTLFGTRLSVMMGGSYAYIIPTISIILSSNNSSNSSNSKRQMFKQSMQAVQGAQIIGSIFPIVTGFFGVWRMFARFLSPLAAVPLVSLTGLGLYSHGFPQLGKCMEIGLPALIILTMVSECIPHLIKWRRKIFRRYAILFTVAVTWLYAEILTAAGAYDNAPKKTQLNCRADRSGLIKAAPWIKVPYPLQWGTPSFDAGDGFALMAASFVAMIESTGTFIASARLAGATPMPPSVLSRGIGWQGIGTLIGGLFGTGNGSAASVENAGFLGSTRVGSRRVVQVSAVFMLFFSTLGKFVAVLASIPLPIMAAIYCVLYAYVASAGISILQFCNANRFRSKFILGFSLFMGLSVPQFFNEFLFFSSRGPVHTNSTMFNDIIQVIFSSPPTVAVILAFFLDCTLILGKKSSGMHWWEKFREFGGDPKTKDYYSLPWNLSKFCPSF